MNNGVVHVSSILPFYKRSGLPQLMFLENAIRNLRLLAWWPPYNRKVPPIENPLNTHAREVGLEFVVPQDELLYNRVVRGVSFPKPRCKRTVREPLVLKCFSVGYGQRFCVGELALRPPGN